MAKQAMKTKETKKSRQTEKIKIHLAPEKAFYFWAGDRFLGIRAASLDEFASILEKVNGESVRFHLARKDFQKWLRNELKENGLAQSFDLVNPNQVPEKLRREILGLVKAEL